MLLLEREDRLQGLRKACSFKVSRSWTPPAVAETNRRCTSLFLTEASFCSVLISTPAALNSSKVVLRAAVRVSRFLRPGIRRVMLERHYSYSNSFVLACS